VTILRETFIGLIFFWVREPWVIAKFSINNTELTFSHTFSAVLYVSEVLMLVTEPLKLPTETFLKYTTRQKTHKKMGAMDFMTTTDENFCLLLVYS